ncbi:MAG: type transport system ATP-binding protein [Acidobacteriota bacterium]|nr:type transport system ATP-binding protein [Acidobacteriota bacterium]
MEISCRCALPKACARALLSTYLGLTVHNLNPTQIVLFSVASRPCAIASDEVFGMTHPAIEVRDLRKMFRKRKGLFKTKVPAEWALDNVSFEVAQGETYGLLGPNGSGKSTLIRILSTLLIADGGTVRLLGHRLPEEQNAVRRLIGRVSVDAAFYKKLSARENLLYTALLYGLKPSTAEKQAMEALEQLGIEERKFSAPLEEMSRGMQQKISIVRALMLNPPLLLLDEPTTGLDPKSRRDVQTFLENLRRREGTTILLTTHDMAEAERLCARIGFLAHGKLVAEGTADALKRQAGVENLDDAFIKLAGEELQKEEAEAEALEVLEEV